MKKEYTNSLVLIFIVCVIIASIIFGGDKDKSNYHEDNDYNFYGDQEKIIDRYDAIYDYWDEISEYVSGTEVVDVCSFESGNCYSLDADISYGQIETIYFSNGGYLYFSAYIDEDGQASDFDEDGDSWDFSLDMDSSIIDDAIYDWASDNDYIIE